MPGDEQYKWWNSETQSNWWDGYLRNVFLLEDKAGIAKSNCITLKRYCQLRMQTGILEFTTKNFDTILIVKMVNCGQKQLYTEGYWHFMNTPMMKKFLPQ
jgi:hypothetical protein